MRQQYGIHVYLLQTFKRALQGNLLNTISVHPCLDVKSPTALVSQMNPCNQCNQANDNANV